jgi:hypothetical protein
LFFPEAHKWTDVQATGDVPLASNYSKVAGWGTQMVPLFYHNHLLLLYLLFIIIIRPPSHAHTTQLLIPYFGDQVAINDLNAHVAGDAKIHLLDTGNYIN